MSNGLTLEINAASDCPIITQDLTMGVEKCSGNLSLGLNLSLQSDCCPPTPQPSTVNTGDSLIRIDQDDFADATNWNGTNDEGVTLISTDKVKIFDNNTNRYLDEGTEWERTANGVHFLIGGFDATVNEYKFYVHINKA